MNSVLLNYYEAIEKASQDMLEAARAGNWDHVVKLEGACALLIAQLKNTAAEKPLPPDEAQLKSRIMQRILVNDAEIRQLAEPWLEDLDDILAGRPEDPALIGSEPHDSNARQGDAMETRPAPLRRHDRTTTGSTSSASRRRARSARCCAAARRLGAAQPERQRRPASSPARSGRSTRSRGTIGFNADPNDPAMQSLLESRRGHGRRLPRQRQAAVRRARPGAGARQQGERAELPVPARDVPLPAPQRLPRAAADAQRADGAGCATPRCPTPSSPARDRHQHRRLRPLPARRRADDERRRRPRTTCASSSTPTPGSTSSCACST